MKITNEEIVDRLASVPGAKAVSDIKEIPESYEEIAQWVIGNDGRGYPDEDEHGAYDVPVLVLIPDWEAGTFDLIRDGGTGSDHVARFYANEESVGKMLSVISGGAK